MTPRAVGPAPLVGDVDAVCAEARSVRGDVRGVVDAIVARRLPLASDAERARVAEAAVARLAGLGELERHLADPDVDEVMVNAGCEVWTERRGELRCVARLDPGAIDVIVERALAPTGRRLDRSSPIVDVRLPGGARLCAVAHPIAYLGTTVAIRRHRVHRFDLASFGGHHVVDVLTRVIAARCNVLVSGATTSGKTSLVAAMLAAVSPLERIVVCEDTAELVVGHAHAVRLEARPAAADGTSATDLAALVRAALRLRPDRLVIGEFRGAEVLAAVEAMNTGHDGSFSTCHANSAVDALRRVETLVMQSAPSWPLAAIRRHVSRSIDVVVHVERGDDGARRVVDVAQVVEGDGDPAVTSLLHPPHAALTRGRVAAGTRAT